MKVLVTGGTGYLGATVASYLATRGHEVTALSRHPIDEAHPWRSRVPNVLRGDLRNADTLSTIEQGRFEAVVHTVSLDHTASEKNVVETCQVNVATTWDLLSRLSKTGLKRFVYFSTQQVYGRVGNEVISEERTPAPQNAYGLTHWMSEEVCALYNRRGATRAVSLRISNGFGAPEFLSANCWWLVLNDFCKSAVEKGEIRLSSDGTPQRDFIHIEDISSAAERMIALPSDPALPTVFNLASGRTTTILELAHQTQTIAQAILKREIPVVLPDGSQSQGVPGSHVPQRFQCDTRRLQAVGWAPKKTVQEGTHEILTALLAHQTVTHG